MIHISLGRARWSQDVGVLAMIPVGSYPVCYLGHVLICLCLHVSMGLGLQSGICGTRWSLAQHVPLTKPCLADDVTCGYDNDDDDGLSCVVGQTVEIISLLSLYNCLRMAY